MQACTFFGHRDCPASVKPKLRAVLVNLIEQKNVTRFYVGNQGAFDAMAYSVLQELSAHYPQICCTVVLAYLPAAGEAPLLDSILPEGIETVSPAVFHPVAQPLDAGACGPRRDLHCPSAGRRRPVCTAGRKETKSRVQPVWLTRPLFYSILLP